MQDERLRFPCQDGSLQTPRHGALAGRIDEAPAEVPATLAACEPGEIFGTRVWVGAVGGTAASVDGGGKYGYGAPGGWGDDVAV
jgi:hypothetical protein